MIEGSGSIPLTNGSGSRRPKNMRIRIRIRIRIQNTAYYAEQEKDNTKTGIAVKKELSFPKCVKLGARSGSGSASKR
jgi:hypothetical protein